MEPREMPKGNRPYLPGTFRLSATVEPMPCGGCGGPARTLVFHPQGDFWTCGGSKCVHR
jgi:hypothetical protein